MNASIKGSIAQGNWYPLDYFTHKGRPLTDFEARTVLSYGLANGYKTIIDIPNEVVEGIISRDEEYDKYIPCDLPDFVSDSRVRGILNCYYGKILTYELIDDIIDDL